ncbi:ATP-binding protein [Streptomyces sp. NBC_00690]|uniref:ATP-binding protein n=1 Tax=Streptomyces sp. NBC_00690 TaxID=2975808 RepID=UPI002E2AE306|nr:ATP-binding protein [Streptomyces sp. NBC_00690]
MPAFPLHDIEATVHVFRQRFTSSPLGARLARHLASYRLQDWGVPAGSAVGDIAALLIAELAANAATHGRVPGADFELELSLTPELLRIDVSDSHARRPPGPGALVEARLEQDGGRGLMLVEALADRWEVVDRAPRGKTVRAELDRQR